MYFKIIEKNRHGKWKKENKNIERKMIKTSRGKREKQKTGWDLPKTGWKAPILLLTLGANFRRPTNLNIVFWLLQLGPGSEEAICRQ